MKKSVVYLLLVVNLLISFPVSFIVNVNANTYLSEEDFLFIAIVCAFVVYILMGLIAWVVYYFMKKKGKTNATKVAMITFTALLVAGGLGSMPQFGEKMKNRNQMLAEREFESGFIESCIENGNKKLSGDGIDGKKIEAYCTCVYSKIDTSYELKDKMMDESIPMNEIMNSPEVMKITADCAFSELQ